MSTIRFMITKNRHDDHQVGDHDRDDRVAAWLSISSLPMPGHAKIVSVTTEKADEATELQTHRTVMIGDHEYSSSGAPRMTRPWPQIPLARANLM